MHSVRSSCHTRNRRYATSTDRGTRRSTSRSHVTFAEGLIIAACVAAVVLSFAHTLAVPSSESPTSVSVRVEASQTLWDLATAHPIEGLTTAQTVEYIQRLNGRSEPSLAVGEVVLVPDAPDSVTALASR